MVGWISADHADGVELRYVLSNRHDLGHGLEGLSEIVLIQTRHDYPFSRFSQLSDYTDEIVSEELCLVHADNITVCSQKDDLRRRCNRCRPEGRLVVRNDFIFRVARIDRRLEDFSTLPCNLGAANATNQFFCFPAEHGSAYDFDPAGLPGGLQYMGFKRHGISVDESEEGSGGATSRGANRGGRRYNGLPRSNIPRSGRSEQVTWTTKVLSENQMSPRVGVGTQPLVPFGISTKLQSGDAALTSTTSPSWTWMTSAASLEACSCKVS